MSKSEKVGRVTLPDNTKNNKVSRQMVSLMADMATYISRHANETLTLARLSREAGLSSSYFQRLFKSVIGVSPKEFQATCKEKLFREKLKNGEDVLSAALDSGYGSTSRIYEHVDGSLGMTPATYRAGGKGENISYTSRNTDFGLLMMAATNRGVCFVQFGETNENLLQNLNAEFPHAKLSATQGSSESSLNDWMIALANHLDISAPLPELPLDIRGTAFQVKVWKFLLSVKPGDVASYTEVATGIGLPKAVRAAANACGSNRIAVLIPCHRVLRADGGLGGYRWGKERKRVLLDKERSAKSCSKLKRHV